MMDGVSERPMKVTLNSFWMDDTEITNDEYKQFVNWVRDSIALRMLVINGRDEFRKPIKAIWTKRRPKKHFSTGKQKFLGNQRRRDTGHSERALLQRR